MQQKMKKVLKTIYLFLRGRILNILSILLTKQSKIPQPKEVKKILVIRIDRIGDVILSTPTLRAIRKNFPYSHISILISPWTQDLLLQCPYVDEVIIYKGVFPKIQDFYFVPTPKIRDFCFASTSLRKRNFDLVFDLYLDYPLKSAVIAYLSGAKYRVGFNVAGRGIFFNIRVMPDKKEKHLIEHTLDIIRAIGADIDSKSPEVSTTPLASEYVENFLIQNNILDSDLLVGIHPGGYYPTQRWPLERFAAVGDEVIEKYQAKVVIIGGLGEEESVEEIANKMRYKPLIWVKEPLRNSVAFIDRCNLLICNHSGTLHIATALGTPTVSTMGPHNPIRWWPWGDRNIVIRKDLPCSPCNKGVCNEHRCLELITLDEVMEAVEIQLEQIRGKKDVAG